MKETITLTFNADGSITSHIEGHKGATCKDINNVIAEAVGGKIVNREATAEQFQQTVKQTVKKQIKI